MVRYITRRVLATILVLFGVSILIFLITFLTPGDPARAQLGQNAPEEHVEALRETMGLHHPMPVQYTIWLRNALTGDLGRSYQHRVSALVLVLERFPNTLILAASSLGASILMGLTIGVIAGTRPNSLADRFATLFGIVGASIPTFVLGIALLLVFSLHLGWLPAVGMYEARGDGGVIDLLKHLILPTITTAAIPAAIILRMVRSAVLETMTLDYIRTARAKGLAERTVVVRHAIRNALPSFIVIIALQAGYLLGGSLITEIIFAWPGIGLQLYTAVGAQDIPVIMTITLLIAILFSTLMLVADILQGVVDPRVRLT